MAKSCTIEGCTGKHYGRGLCQKHHRQRQVGDDWQPLPRLSSEERFWAKVDKNGPVPTHRPDLGPCWLWTAATAARGYGQFSLNKYPHRAHRVSYLWAKGELPEGLDIDHLCRVITCVNPEHLEAVPHRVNVLRGTSPSSGHARKTHCPQGHPYDEENTRIYRGSRRCRACQAERNQARSKARLGVAS